jgi:glycosyltransferase involved in cell wall biosynthesis
MPKVSIIIPTYNRAKLLTEAIESVIAQSFTDFEIIVVDDGSSDDTPRIITDLCRMFSEIKYVYQKNHGVSRARNVGIRESTGEYICFLDSDDLWQKDKLAAQIEFFIQNPSAGVCYTGEIWIRDGKRVNPLKKHAKYSGDIFERCLPLCIISASSVMIRRELFDRVGLFDEDLPVCEDYDLWLRIAAHYPVYFIDRLLITKHNQHGGPQLSASTWGMDRYRILALEKLLKSSLTRKQRKLVKREIRRKCWILFRGGFKRGNFRLALKYFGKWLILRAI